MIGLRQWLSVGLVCIVSAVAVLGTVHVGGTTPHVVTVDLSRPLSVEAPFEVVPVGDNGEQGLYLKPHVGRGWKGEAGGAANYQCFAPADGTYYVWTLCHWGNACSNAVYLQVDQDRKLILGNDPVYDKWHWVRSLSLPLKKGIHRLVLSNHSDGVALRELVLTTDRDHGPETLIPIRNDLYWEGFDGCGNGTFSLWEQVSGTWTVQSKDPMQDPTEKAVIGRSTDAALLTLKADEWENVDINVSVQTLKSANTGSYVGVCFGLEGPDQYFLLRWRDVPQMRMADMQVLKRSSRNEGVVANLQVPWPEATWHNVCISLRAGAVAVSVDGGKEAHVAIADSIAGGIGLYLSGNTSASFDNISIRSAAPNPEPVRPGLKMSQMNRPCSSQ